MAVNPGTKGCLVIGDGTIGNGRRSLPAGNSAPSIPCNDTVSNGWGGGIEADYSSSVRMGSLGLGNGKSIQNRGGVLPALEDKAGCLSLTVDDGGYRTIQGFDLDGFPFEIQISFA